MASLEDVLADIAPLDESVMNVMRARLDQLTKPQGSLGRLEELAIRLAGIRGELFPSLASCTVVVAAGDHGVTVEGVSAFPSEVTHQMVALFSAGRAAINVLARTLGAEVLVVDAGVAGMGLERQDHIIPLRIGSGTANFRVGPAMTRQQASAAIQGGIDVGLSAIASGADVLITGDMGIGNTTSAAAITAAMTGAAASQVVGRGTGIDDPGLTRKLTVIEDALNLHQVGPGDPIGVLAAVGGFEIGVLAGVILAGASSRRPIIIDGVVSGAAALLACELAPHAVDFCIAGHRSTEPAHTLAFQHLGLVPFLDLQLRLGEGTGAILALPLLRSAVAIARDMWTFAEAGVAHRESAP
ncbi:MAG: nicotinate-nucleotide--dimethylbenzimidazole phosphoribosyltransferase [Chloroflexi bacterium]|nr:nicotinate-nucleotide--dimethylbenzimidazole phosphoribosyltransferase [Chloroflexota bacterium]